MTYFDLGPYSRKLTTSAPEVATSAQPAMTGGAGGLYGAPAALARDDRGKGGAAPVRTVQLTATPTTGRGD